MLLGLEMVPLTILGSAIFTIGHIFSYSSVGSRGPTESHLSANRPIGTYAVLNERFQMLSLYVSSFFGVTAASSQVSFCSPDVQANNGSDYLDLVLRELLLPVRAPRSGSAGAAFVGGEDGLCRCYGNLSPY